ncbi:winged helix-turn-helix domain-containing protein [Paraburkholderia sp. CI3]|uniref:response regulator transcription factor n=1 Tax=Paraburkholderia sp. CI3 TaxID=2991060 RepID=UPI003D25A517
MKIAVLTRNARTYHAVEQSLVHDGLVCHRFTDDLQLVRELRRDGFDLLILDGDGTDLSGHPVFFWRDCHSHHRVPVIVTASFADRRGISSAFEIGADDVVSLPIQHHELAVRARIAIRRSSRLDTSSERLELAGYALDKRAGEVTRGSESIRLTSREFAIAWLFFSKPGEFFSRKQLAAAIWGSSAEIANRTLEQHIYKMRKKLSLADGSSVQLRTVYSLGYKLEIHDVRAASNTSVRACADSPVINPDLQPAPTPAPTLSNVLAFDAQRVRLSASPHREEAVTG